jgi:O-antigen/teichoic acid export membrane protein
VITAVIALPYLIPLVYGASFVPAVVPSALLFASLLFLAPASLCWMTFNAKGHPHLTSLLLTAGGIIGPVLTYSMIRAGYGLMGVAAGAVLTSAITLALAVLMLQRLQHYRRRDLREGLVRAGMISRRAASQVRSYMHRLIGPQA